MQKGINQFLVFMTVFAVVVTSFITPTTAYADDGPTGGETSEPAVVEEQEPAVTEDQEPAEETAPVETVEEILEQIPDSTQLVVLDETGTPEPLASQDAADIIVNGDPMWCPDGVLPGGVGCTASFTTFTGAGGLLTALAGGSFTGNGVIYVESTYNSALESGDVNIDGSVLTGLGNLTIQGGWDGVLGGTNVTGTSTFNGISLNIFNWSGSVTLNDLVINTTNTGLYVQNDDNIVLDNVDAQSSNFYGAYLDNADALSATVQISDSDFSDTGAVTTDDGGLFVLSNGDVTLTNVTSSDHQNYGALIYGNNVSVTNGTFNNQSVDSGLWVNAYGNIILNNVIASNNYYEGAILDATYGTGDVTVTNSTFDDNGEYGLAAGSFGNILVDFLTATNNGDYGAYLNSLGTGNITVTNSSLTLNGIKGLYAESSGDITLDNVDASDNGSYGAYLKAAYGAGNIFVSNSTFNGNGSVGLAAMTGAGDIVIDNIFVDGAGLTDIGAYLGAYDGGAVNVSNSTFQNMTSYGLKIGTSGPVNLTNVTASDNGSHGASIFNSHACGKVQGIDVTVDGGFYQNNGGYGLYVSPGPEGTLTFGAASTFGGNGLGDYLLDLVVDCKPHEDHPKPPESPKKPVNVVELPSTDGTPVEQDCEIYSGTELILPNGTRAFIGCPFNGDSLIEEVGFDGLPSPLPTGPEFVSGVSLDFNATADEEGKTEEAAITLSFDIPEGMEGKLFSILYWDPEANGGLGDWVELPLARAFGDSKFPLHPEDPDDPRMSTGVEIVDGKVTVTVNFPGTFVLVAK
jgi:hypothetical protein